MSMCRKAASPERNQHMLTLIRFLSLAEH